MAVVLQFLLGGVLFVLAIAWKLHDVRRGIVLAFRNSATVRAWSHFAGQVCLSLLAFYAIIDPLIPGTAIVEVHAPSKFPTTADHLILRAIPVGFRGPAGGTRIITTRFDQSGLGTIQVHLELMETRLKLEVLDESMAEPVVTTKTVYISPFVRRQVCKLSVRM
jgi:hypothetical protein